MPLFLPVQYFSFSPLSFPFLNRSSQSYTLKRLIQTILSRRIPSMYTHSRFHSVDHPFAARRNPVTVSRDHGTQPIFETALQTMGNAFFWLKFNDATAVCRDVVKVSLTQWNIVIDFRSNRIRVSVVLTILKYSEKFASRYIIVKSFLYSYSYIYILISIY